MSAPTDTSGTEHLTPALSHSPTSGSTSNHAAQGRSFETLLASSVIGIMFWDVDNPAKCVVSIK